jgi:hypothetical protein
LGWEIAWKRKLFKGIIRQRSKFWILWVDNDWMIKRIARLKRGKTNAVKVNRLNDMDYSKSERRFADHQRVNAAEVKITNRWFMSWPFKTVDPVSDDR